MKKNIVFILLSPLLFFNSCVQRYNPPALKTPSADTWKAPVDKIGEEIPCPEPIAVHKKNKYQPWWEVFNDPVLNDLETEACANSPSIANAVARLEEAQAVYIIARSTLFPELNLDITASRQRLPSSQLASPGNISTTATSPSQPTTASPVVIPSTSPTAQRITVIPPTIPQTTSTSTLQLPKPKHHISELAVLPQISYELDFWGKHWQEASAQWKRVEAQEEDLQTAFLLLTTSVASTYLNLRTIDQEIEVLEKTEKSRQHIFNLQQEKFQAGLINDLDTMQAKVLLNSAQAELENTKIFRAVTENALAVLVGTAAPDFKVAEKTELPPIPFIPPSLPVELLETRPDIRQAQKLLEAFSLDVGVAKTHFFPSVTTFFEAGYISNKISSLFKWKNHVWTIAGDALTPIFNAGRISSEVEAAIARYEQGVASYINTVLTAFGDVESALSSVEGKRKQLKYLNEQVDAAQSVYRISSTRYNMGLVDYLTVVDAERSLLESQRQQVLVVRDQYSSVISLIKSLGGVWDNKIRTSH